MKFTKKDFLDLLKASYDPKMYDIRQYNIDKEISNKIVKIYTIEGSKDVVAVHRGSNSIQDWVDNVNHLVGVDLTSTKTYKAHLTRQLKAVKKYGKENLVCIGHSRGGLYCKQFYKDKLCKQSIVYNKPISPKDLVQGLFEKKKDPNDQSIRTSGDLTSIGETNENTVVIPSENVEDIIENHKTDNIKDLDDKIVIGSGIPKHSNEVFNVLKEYIDYSKLRKDQLRKILKPHKKQMNIKLTNLTKPEMIKFIKQII